jgi:hypothetical protein
MAEETRGLIRTLLGSFGARLRFPQLFGIAATLFLVDLLIPDLIPFIDEILLGLLTLLLGSLQEKPTVPAVEKPPVKDITPPGEMP